MTETPFYVVFGDVHNDISLLAGIPDLDRAEGIIISGDLTLGGGVQEALRVLEPAARNAAKLFAQIGNMDKAEITTLLKDRGWNLHAEAVRIFPGVYALGLGTCPVTPFHTPSEYTEERLAEWLEETAAAAETAFAAERASGTGDAALRGQPARVLVSHTPPYGTACDRLKTGGHAGSRAVRDFIEKYRPEVCLCGHIHEARGEDRLGPTQIVNPGPLSSGSYALLLHGGGHGGTGVRAELLRTPPCT
ncbi:MAG: metallophosphoesterase [Desulfovibrio sp.]|jgi:Icc-related predicted phosphoesterase|nr:metallophosphoesterase [Desulfovibrio sp.]